MLWLTSFTHFRLFRYLYPHEPR